MFLNVRNQKYFGKLSTVKAKAAPAFSQSSANITASDQYCLWFSRSAQISKKWDGKKWQFFYLQPFLQVKSSGFFPNVKGNAKIYHFRHLCVFSIFPLPVPWDLIIYLDLCNFSWIKEKYNREIHVKKMYLKSNFYPSLLLGEENNCL